MLAENASNSDKYAQLERDRLRRFRIAVAFKSRCARRLWTKQQRKVESEVLRLPALGCSWKLGTDECVFPGRERVVLRRKYQSAPEGGSAQGPAGSAQRRQLESAGEVDLISQQLVNYIKRPGEQRAGAEDDSEGDEEERGAEEEGEGDAEGAEGDEGGGGPQGAEQGEDDFQEGNRLVTGPCHSGARRSNFGHVRLEAEVVLITPSGNYPGRFALSKSELSFISSSALLGDAEAGTSISADAKKKFTRRRWTMSAVSQMFLRRYRLRDTSLEVFFRRGKHRNFFIDFGHTPEDARRRNDFARTLMRLAPRSSFKQWPSMSPYRLASALGVQTQWQAGELSNFEYLMALNTAAGRSYNDLCQVPCSKLVP